MWPAASPMSRSSARPSSRASTNLLTAGQDLPEGGEQAVAGLAGDGMLELRVRRPQAKPRYARILVVNHVIADIPGDEQVPPDPDVGPRQQFRGAIVVPDFGPVIQGREHE